LLFFHDPNRVVDVLVNGHGALSLQIRRFSFSDQRSKRPILSRLGEALADLEPEDKEKRHNQHRISEHGSPPLSY
jgi:hypothetical protein